MKPSPSPSQVWKRRLILSSSPVLEVSALLLPVLFTSATAAAAIMRPAPEEVGKEEDEEASLPRAPGIPSPAAPAKCDRQHKAGAGALSAPHPPPAEAQPGRDPAGAWSGVGAAEARSCCRIMALSGAGIAVGPPGASGRCRQPGAAALSAGGRPVQGDPSPPRAPLLLLGLGRAGSLLRGCCFGRSVEAKNPQRFL